MPLIFSVEVIICGGEMITFLVVIITATTLHSTATCSLYILMDVPLIATLQDRQSHDICITDEKNLRPREVK